MVKLNNLKKKALTKEDFETYPVWTWDDSTEYQVPVSENEPSWSDYDNYFIKAKFETNGNEFDGYLIGTEVFYGFCLFINGKEFIFNLFMHDFIKKTLHDIFHLLNCKPFKMFPISYKSPVHFKDYGSISGSLSPKNFDQ